MKEEPKFLTTSAAETDLVDIWKYIADRNPDAARKLIDELVAVCGLLSDEPKLGEVFDTHRPFLRRFCHGNYVIYYQTSTDPITVVGLLHGARDPLGLI